MTIAGLLFWIFASAACVGAVAVVVSQNIVRMAFWLIVSLGSVAGLFFMLNADFVGATQLLVYVGGTVVLLVFGVMLTSSGRHSDIKTSPGEGVAGAIIGCLMLTLIVSTVAAVDWNETAAKMGQKPTVGEGEAVAQSVARPIGLSLLGLRPDKDLGSDSETLSTGYLLPFEIASVHLLVVLVGAAYLARAKRRVRESVESS